MLLSGNSSTHEKNIKLKKTYNDNKRTEKKRNIKENMIQQRKIKVGLKEKIMY